MAALAGSAIGALASFVTTWITHRYQERSQRHAQEMSRREKLYGDFIDEASKLFAEALMVTLERPDKLVSLYSMRNKLRLFASSATIKAAEEVIQAIVQTFLDPAKNFDIGRFNETRRLDFLHEFTTACRRDLGG